MLKASVGGGAATSALYRHPLLAGLIPFLGPFVHAPPRRSGGWDDLRIILCSLLMSWSEAKPLCDRFAAAHDLAGPLKAGTYTGFSTALQRRGVPLVGRLRAHPAMRLRVCADGIWTIRGWCVFVIDGSKFDAPRTAANERVMGVAAKDGAGPQMLATILVHLGTCVLWNWRIDTARGSERKQLQRLFGSTPRNSLILGDAGFMGFDCLRAVVGSGRHVLVRLAGNASLITGLTERADVVAAWPKELQHKAEPLLLRIIRVSDGRGGKVVLGTSVLDPERLSNGDAAAFYRMRWGVEVCYRSLKQTLDRRKMRSAAPRQAWLELHWSMVGFMALGLLTLSWMGRSRSRRRWSVGGAIRIVRHAARSRTNERAHRHLRGLREAVTGDNTRRSKKARNWPHKKRQKPLSPPRIRRATVGERQRYAAILASAP